ncbi:MAG: Flp family type IVb pilin [Bryobacteraceae bacterium]
MMRFLREDQGQDLVEYTLLLAFVAMAASALFTGAGKIINGIWSKANSTLSVANTDS